jgi:TonB family protein
MNKKILAMLTPGLVIFGMFASWAFGQRSGVASVKTGWSMRMRVLKAVRGEAVSEPAKAVTSSFLQAYVTATLRSEIDLAEELKQVRRTFNFRDVTLLTEANFVWKTGNAQQEFHIFRIDGREYLVLITPGEAAAPPKFRVEVFEQSEKAKTNLLDSEAAFPEKNITVFGFEGLKGEAYFLAFRVAPSAEGDALTSVEKTHPTYDAADKPAEKIASESASGNEPVRVRGLLKPPIILRQVDPVYPKDALEAGVEGTVILEATTDIYGRMQKISVLRSIPMLDRAAVEAVRQWVYEPMIVNGKPRGTIFTISVPFVLKDRTARAEVLTDAEPVRIAAGGVTPVPVKKVEPVYPEIARQSRLEGEVILEILIDVAGRVRDAKVIRSVPLLDRAAFDALSRWTYEPVIIDGKPVPVIFTVSVNFLLTLDKPVVGTIRTEAEDLIKKAVAAGAVEGVPAQNVSPPLKIGVELKPPIKIFHVDPHYPEIARQARVDGVVILKATTDVYGRVKNIRVLSSVPLLDQAAIDAVKQWVYEPNIVDGLAREATFIVPVVFAFSPDLPLAVATILPWTENRVPKRKRSAEVEYPEEAVKNKISGEVVMEASIDASGRVTAVKPVVSVPILDKPAIEAIMKWTFEPYFVGGKSQPLTIGVLVNYVLPKPIPKK